MKTIDTDWIETHHEIVAEITLIMESREADHDPRRAALENHQDEFGMGGMWELAEKWTDEFSGNHKDRAWEGEYFEELQAFIDKKIAELPYAKVEMGKAKINPIFKEMGKLIEVGGELMWEGEFRYRIVNYKFYILINTESRLAWVKADRNNFIFPIDS